MVPPLRKGIRRLKNSIASRVINKPSSVPQKWRQSFIWITSCLAILSDTPGRLSGPPQTLPYSVLLHVGFIKLTSHLATGELLPRLSILTTTASCPQAKPCGGFRFYDTFLKVTLTGRYPARCPVEPGLSSSPETGSRLSFILDDTLRLYHNELWMSKVLSKYSEHFEISDIQDLREGVPVAVYEVSGSKKGRPPSPPTFRCHTIILQQVHHS